MADANLAMKELAEVFEDLTTLLKHPDAVADLTARGINASLALVAAEGLVAYVVDGDKQRAADDLGTVAEEIASRLRASKEGAAS